MSAVTFLSHPLGLGGQREFELASVDENEVLFTLRGETGTRLFLIQPQQFFADYAPHFSAETLHALGLGPESGDQVVFVVVHPGDDTNSATANLLAPILLNSRTGQAEQVVLDDNTWPLRAPLPVA